MLTQPHRAAPAHSQEIYTLANRRSQTLTSLDIYRSNEYHLSEQFTRQLWLILLKWP